MALAIIVVMLAVLVIAVLWKRFADEDEIPDGLKRLPGPKGWPILGCVPEVPETLVWLKFSDWGKQYGPIYQCDLAGTNHIWISSDRIAHDLLSKKAAIYSDRPHIPALIEDNRTSSQYLPLLSKNEGWTRQRRFAHSIMRQSEKLGFNHYPELEAIRMCVELMTEPEKYNHIMESFVARVTSRLAWGHSDASDELKQRARELLIGVSPNGALGNRLPFIMALPDWLSPAKVWERRRARTERTFFRIMQNQVRRDMAEKRSPSGTWMKFFFDHTSTVQFKGDLEGAYAVGMHGIAGALTIAAPMQAFCLAMCHYPQYMSRLQQEIDEVCGNRMPAAEDKANLPFLRAVIREVIRWRPPVPTGIPHYLTQDDAYDGYHIPKGSVMHPLEWSISRDPETYPDPEAFNPLRWLEPHYPTYREPLTQYPTILNMSQFGYGKRTCQGQTVTEADLLVGIGSIVWLFNISKARQTPVEHHDDLPPTLNPPLPEAVDDTHGTAPFEIQREAERRSVTLNRKMTLDENGSTGEPLGLLAREKQADPTAGMPSAFLRSTEERLYASPVAESKQYERRGEQQRREEDPTLAYSALLIAKPLPFKFDLQVRDRGRAEWVMGEFVAKRLDGEFPPAREYWGPSQGAGKELGWGKV